MKSFLNRIITFFIKIDFNTERYLNKFLNSIFYQKYKKAIFFSFLFSTLTVYFLLFNFNYYVSLGGDDSKSYLFYPNEFLAGYTPNHLLNSENTLNLISVFRNITLSVENIYFIVSLIAGATVFYTLKEIADIFKRSNKFEDNYLFLIGSILYVFNPSMVTLGWEGHWLSIFALNAIPIIFLIYLKLINKTLNFYNIIFLNLLLTTFSLFFENFPHLVALGLVIASSLPILLIKIFTDFKYYLKNISLIIVTYLLMNIDWIYNLYLRLYLAKNPALEKYSEISPAAELKNTLNYFYERSYLLENIFLSKSVFEINDNFYAFYILILVITIIFFLTIVIKNKSINIKDPKTSLITLLLICFVVSGYLNSLATTQIGSKAFIFLSNYFPPLGVLRNYENKTIQVYSLIFTYIFITFVYLRSKLNSLKNTFLITFITYLVILGSYQQFFRYQKQYFGLTPFRELNKNIIETSNFIKNNNEETHLYLPLTDNNWVYFENENSKYKGVFPGVYLSGSYFKSRFELNTNDTKILNDGDQFLKYLAKRGINYIVFDNLASSKYINIKGESFVDFTKGINYTNVKDTLENNYQKVFESTDKNYSIYKLKNNFDTVNEVIFIDDNISSFYKDQIEKDNKNDNSFFITKSENYKDIASVQYEKTTNGDKDLIRSNLDKYQPQDFDFNKVSSKMYVISFSNSNPYNLINLKYPEKFNLSIDILNDLSGSDCITNRITKIDNCKMEDNLIRLNKNENNLHKVLKYEPKKTYIILRNKDESYEVTFNDLSINTGLYQDGYFRTEKDIYQKPEILKVEKISRYSFDEYKIKIKLKNNQPFIILNDDFFSFLLNIEVNNQLEKVVELQKSTFLSYWIVYPKSNTNNSEVELSFINPHNKNIELLRQITQFAKFLALVVIIFSIIRFYWKKKLF